MSVHFADWDDRALDLAVDRCTEGLDAEDRTTLDRLVDEADLEEFEQAVAAIALSGLGPTATPPSDLIARLEQAGRRQVGDRAAATPEPPPRGTLRALTIGFGGWLVAASLLFALWVPERRTLPTEERQALIASASDLLRLEWTPTEDPAATGASGDVVWSSERQHGYLRFEGLAPNDPRASQYQLWIFDRTRADWEAKPVDGGVFDVGSTGEVVVPIDAKLPVGEAVLFAVTIEAPGGVVVSERERLALLAQI